MEASFGRTPHPDTLGYQAALDAGFAIIESGASGAALPYFQRAVGLRSTSIALTQMAKCLRDLGRQDEAAVAYRRAVTASGGTGHARVALISHLVEMGEFAEAVALAQTAAVGEPDNPAVLNVLASCFEGLMTLERDSRPVEQHALLSAEVRRLRARARELQPESQQEWMQRRRDRTFRVHSIAPITTAPSVPVEQPRTAPVSWGERATTQDVPPRPAEEGDEVESGAATAATPKVAIEPPLESQLKPGLLVRWLRTLLNRKPNS